MLEYFSKIWVRYLEYLRSAIWRICSQLSGGSGASYLNYCENKANSAQLELELGLSLAIFEQSLTDGFGIIVGNILQYTGQFNPIIGPKKS